MKDLFPELKRNSNDFSFIDTIASFVNNNEFRKGYDQLKCGNDNKNTYVWSVLSAIGSDYAETIYENVLNYLDNVSNVDLCKIKALQSMITILGVKYNVLDYFEKIPVEIANLIDILSINRSYLLHSDIFKTTFYTLLKNNGCIGGATPFFELSNDIAGISKTTYSELSTTFQTSDGKLLTEKLVVLDQDKYLAFLENVYYNVLTSMVFLQYADAEATLSSEYEYIYEYIEDQLISQASNSSNIDQTTYDKEISNLKIKYKIDKSFDQIQIVDDIECGIDAIENYNIYEQKVLLREITHREEVYSSQKTFNPAEKFLGYNITRYSYYREKKVKEYFNFIQTTYNNLLVENDFINAADDSFSETIQVYDKDHNYFHLNQTKSYALLQYDTIDKQIVLQIGYIQEIAKLLAKQTIEISEIREQLKIQMQKNYMRGTFLLMSYIVNEYLKYNVANKYGDYFYTDEQVSLKNILYRSLSSDDNIMLTEYFDNTEYFNITKDTDTDAQFGQNTNPKFWDNEFNKLGQTTQDLPLNEIENFYLESLHLKNRGVSDLSAFLSVIFEYGANNSYINISDKITDMMNYGDFVSQIRDGRFIGEPSAIIEKLYANINMLNVINSDIEKYTASDYTFIIGNTLEDQLTDLKNKLFGIYTNWISNQNIDIIQEKLDQYTDNLDTAYEFSTSLNDLSVRYEQLKTIGKYQIYISEYRELVNAYFKQKIHNFYLSCISDIGFNFKNINLQNDLDYVLRQYNNLSGNVYNQLFSLSVWPTDKISDPTIEYWQYYIPSFTDELTSVTEALKNYLASRVDVEEQEAIQHVQNHYDTILGYKNELNRILDECENAYAKLEAFKDGVEAGTGVEVSKDLEQTVKYWDQQIVELVTNGPTKVKEDDGSVWWDTSDMYEEGSELFWTVGQTKFYSDGIDDGDGVTTQLSKLRDRCYYPSFPVLIKKKNYLSKSFTGSGDPNEKDDATIPDEIAPCTYFKTKNAVDKWATAWNDKGTPTEFSYEPVEWYIPVYKTAENTAVDLNNPVEKWKDYYSATAAEDIVNSLNLACEDLPATINLINSELNCLRGAKYELKVPKPDIDSVRDDARSLYDDLIGKLTQIDDWIKVDKKWKELSSDTSTYTKDPNIYVHCKRLARISDIINKNPSAYNCRYLDIEWQKIATSVDNIISQDDEYFNEYINDESLRLDKRILAISDYMVYKDAKNHTEVSSQIVDISSQYIEQLETVVDFAIDLKREEVSEVNNDYSYNFSQYSFPIPGLGDPKRDYIDYLLSGDYVNEAGGQWPEKLSGMVYWIPEVAKKSLLSSEQKQIELKVPTLDEYQRTQQYVDRLSTKYLTDKLLSSTSQLSSIGIRTVPDAISVVIQEQKDEITYISSQTDIYEANREIYLKYNGCDIGYDPFYNYKNQAYSSYQIHPYLYEFVEKSNIIYPLANNFFISFSEEYENELYRTTLDDIIGKYGNVINLWKNGMFDWTSYQTRYEAEMINQKVGSKQLGLYNFSGAFYPPALEEFLSNTSKFIQDVQDNTEDSFYFHLNLSQDECNRIAEQLIAYEDAIRQIVQCPVDETFSPALSTEFDIYKYTEDIFGNSLILFKSYQYLYEGRPSDYIPSYNEKKNAPGELWMRIKNHPLALPAFDLRTSFQDLSQYAIKSDIHSTRENINTYIPLISQWYSNGTRGSLDPRENIFDITLDTVAINSKVREVQHLRCFFDMDLDPQRKAILLTTSYPTGDVKNSRGKYIKNISIPTSSTFSYANSSVIVAQLKQEYDLNNNCIFYSFTKSMVGTDSNSGVDDIQNPGILYTEQQSYAIKSSNSANQDVKFEFVGFSKYTTKIHALFIKKYISTNAFTVDSYLLTKQPVYMTLYYVSFKCGSSIDARYENTEDLRFDVFSTTGSKLTKNISITNKYGLSAYAYSNVVVTSYDDKALTIGFISERIQDEKYSNNIQVVSYIDYNTQVENVKNTVIRGRSTTYPRSTAIVQTNDSQHINIYNSFDSFAQYVVIASFTFSATKLRYDNTRYFNLNTDIGFLPIFQGLSGTSDIKNNMSLSGSTTYNLELLGTEKTDIAYTPIIVNPEDDSYGRVTEDYKEMNQFSAYSPELSVQAQKSHTKYSWELSGMMNQEAYQEFQDNSDLLRYKYQLVNMRYPSKPILTGVLSAKYPLNYYYLSSEKYDILSGQDMIGPNNIVYQDVSMTNHINNISGITLEVIYDPDTLLPTRLDMSCSVRVIDRNNDQVLDKNTFRLMVYSKQQLKTYQFYHIIENADQSYPDKITNDETYQIDFSKISQLSSYEINGKKPFYNYSGLSSPSMMSAMLEFKYSEDEVINLEFPYINSQSIEDDIIEVDNSNDNIYFYTLDDHTTINVPSFMLSVYNPSSKQYIQRKINTKSKAYDLFYDNALRIETTYNVELISENPKEYGIILYFNYKNYTNPTYVNFKQEYPPKGSVCESTDPSLKNTYLVLKPGQSGQLDLRVDYVYYDKLKSTDMQNSITGAKTDILKTYYILNVSDSKPKFILSRKPFQSNLDIDDFANYTTIDNYDNSKIYISYTNEY